MHTTSRPARGFTLLESMVAVGVAAILSAIALPSIESQVQRVRRADGVVSLLAAQLAQERWRSGTLAYGTLAEIGVAAKSMQGHYRLAVRDPGPAGFTLTATATGVQQRDVRCRVLRLSVDGGETRFASGHDDAAANDEALNRRCWNR